MKFLGRKLGWTAIAVAGMLLAGCQTEKRPDFGFDPLAPNPPMSAPAASAPTPVTAPVATPAPAVMPVTPAAPTPSVAAPVPAPAPMPAATVASDTGKDISVTQVHIGDSVSVTLADIPDVMVAIDNTIKEDGSITLWYDQKFQAAGKTIGALQSEIRDRYVPKYWKYLTVTIKIQDRFYFIGGEVRQPGRQVYTGYMTVLRAIDTAGGFTDYASKGGVEVTRPDGTKLNVDCKKALKKPNLDLQVFPGDRINVPKRII